MFEAENSCNQGMTSIVLVEEIYAYSNGKPKIITEFLDELQTYNHADDLRYPKSIPSYKLKKMLIHSYEFFNHI